jgi:UPF0716 protein FxsA
MWVLAPLLLLPIIEIGLFVTLGAWLGLWLTLAIVVLTGFFGAYLIRSQGVNALGQLQSARTNLQNPLSPIANGLMSVVAGVLLMLPGFFTDTLGLVLLIPPVRRAIISGISSRMMIRPTNRGFAEDATDWTDPMHPRGKATGDIIDGDYYEVQPASRAVPGAAGTTKH